MRFQGENDDERDPQGDDPSLGGQPDNGITTKGGDADPNAPGGDILNPGGNPETPRDRLPGSGGATPPMPTTPHPAGGAISSSGGDGDQTSGLRPFAPMSSGPSGQPQPGIVPPGPIGHPSGGSSRLFGSLGGLKGGGAGALSTAVNPNLQGSPEIAQLIQMLQRRKGMF